MTLIVLPPRITHDNAQSALQTLRAFIDVVNESPTIDLSVIHYCDSAGLAALIEAKTYATDKRLFLNYINSGAQLRELMAFLKVEALLLAV